MKLKSKSRWGLLCAAICILSPVSATAAIFSGDPVADGWNFQGNSLTLGDSYVRGTGAINFNLYSTLLTVTNSLLTECGTTCSTWQLGDQVLGMAATFNGNAGQQQVTGNGILPGVIMKFGETTSPFSLSSNPSPSGNGLGSQSTNAPIGSVLGRINAPGSSGVSGGTLQLQKTTAGSDGVAIGSGFLAFNAIMNGELFISVEGLLNVTRLNAANPAGLGGPVTFGGKSIIAVQRGNGSSTDGLVASFADSSVPEPSTGLLAAGALAAAWAIRRRRSS